MILPADFSIAKIHQGLTKKEFSARELVEFFLEKIKKEDKDIFAFLSVFREEAISQAREVDDLLLTGADLPLLAGIPCAIKDNILIKGFRCTAGSKMLENYIAPEDATVVKKLKAQKAIILGKTNLDEFAMGSSTENSAFGVTKNPYDLSRVSGGSSGGSAAAVASKECVFALGSDTGGSIRLPASFCGVVGLKPTYGAVSRYGLIAFASSLDQIGPLARTVDDVRIVFEAIKGKDPLDSTSVDFIYEKSLEKEFQIRDLRIGIPKEYFIKGISSEVEEAVKTAVNKYQEMGAKIEEVSLPHAEYALPCYYIIAPSEASANLARYDGIKYGYSEINNPQSSVQDLMDIYFKSRGNGFGKEVKRRIMLGTYALSSGYYEAFYLRAQKVRSLIKRDFEEVFKKVECILAPTAPFVAFKIGEKITDPLSMYLADVYTVSVNLAGLPALSLPCGLASGLPVGLQIIGKPFEERKILEIGRAFENC